MSAIWIRNGRPPLVDYDLRNCISLKSKLWTSTDNYKHSSQFLELLLFTIQIVDNRNFKCIFADCLRKHLQDGTVRQTVRRMLPPDRPPDSIIRRTLTSCPMFGLSSSLRKSNMLNSLGLDSNVRETETYWFIRPARLLKSDCRPEVIDSLWIDGRRTEREVSRAGSWEDQRMTFRF